MIDEWYIPETEDAEAIKKHYARFLIMKCWDFLRPYFASRGYLLYEYGLQAWTAYPPMQPEAPLDSDFN